MLRIQLPASKSKVKPLPRHLPVNTLPLSRSTKNLPQPFLDLINDPPTLIIRLNLLLNKHRISPKHILQQLIPEPSLQIICRKSMSRPNLAQNLHKFGNLIFVCPLNPVDRFHGNTLVIRHSEESPLFTPMGFRKESFAGRFVGIRIPLITQFLTERKPIVLRCVWSGKHFDGTGTERVA